MDVKMIPGFLLGASNLMVRGSCFLPSWSREETRLEQCKDMAMH